MKKLKDDMTGMLIMDKVPGFEIGFVCKTQKKWMLIQVLSQ